MLKKLLPLLLFNIVIFTYSQNYELPTPFNPDAVIEKEFYSLEYNELYEQASWVSYELTREEVLSTTKRMGSFKYDSAITTGSASLNDYKGSGYDRGHLAPAADMKMSPMSMSESLYMSNMSPQHPSFNRGIWSKLESYVRTWAYENGVIYIVTGPVLTKNYPAIGENKVAIPEYFYKVVLDYSGDEIKAIGFILPNEKADSQLESYAATIDEVESLTGIDFYPLLPNLDEEDLESSYDLSLWPFKSFSAPKVEVLKE